VLIIIPIIIELTAGMGLDPKMYVISQAVISNIGGTATLIGDPPNIIIGSKVGLTFNQFMLNLTLPGDLLFFCSPGGDIWLFNRSKFKAIDGQPGQAFLGTAAAGKDSPQLPGRQNRSSIFDQEAGLPGLWPSSCLSPRPSPNCLPEWWPC
jgi:di/tricarboxylate transporter